MKVIVINFSGNVGKSIVAQHLLKPRIDNSVVIAVESINFDGSQDEKIKGKAFSDIMDKAMLHDNVIIDVGASNVEEFLNQMKKQSEVMRTSIILLSQPLTVISRLKILRVQSLHFLTWGLKLNESVFCSICLMMTR
ncbi:hypothetical protein PCI56_04290 [Plesiomonas shigelloides subsp. oncorhynchi]|nr:hypothetical protein [Plesiomonas shigelloides]